MLTGQIWKVQVGTGQVRTGQVGIGQVRTGQAKYIIKIGTREVRIHDVRSHLIYSSLDKSGKDLFCYIERIIFCLDLLHIIQFFLIKECSGQLF